ncbi:MAG TPA: PadR family transcriptional regulator [Gemmatimonadaceae bacterium]
MREELLPGTLDMLILKAISLAPMHGYAIAQHLRQVSKEVLQVEEGSLYPALQRVLANGWAKAEWRNTPTKRRARYYTITAAGRQQLGEKVSSFQRMQGAIQRVLRTQE